MNILQRPDLMDRLAAAYALGTLRGGARRRFEELARQSPTLRVMAQVWQERFMSMTELQQSEAPGMQPDGSSAAGQCAEGQQLELPITLQPGKCYTVIAVSMGVQELDAQIATQPLAQAPPLVLAQDNASGGQAVVAGKGSCFKNPSPVAVPGKVIIKATRGTGAAVAQIYVK